MNISRNTSTVELPNHYRLSDVDSPLCYSRSSWKIPEVCYFDPEINIHPYILSINFWIHTFPSPREAEENIL